MLYTRSALHQKILTRADEICRWFEDRSKAVRFPIYSSYDVRDAGYKVANVDANIYPAGFNNICPTDKETSVQVMAEYLKDSYGSSVKKIVLVTEEHTQNPYYWDNVDAIRTIIESAGVQVRVGFARPLPEPLNIQSANGVLVKVESAMADSELLREFKPDLIVNNNDFSDAHEEWAQGIQIRQNPPRELGWYQRKKSNYFINYNTLVHEFADVAQIDPSIFEVRTEFFPHFDIADESSKRELATKVDALLKSLKNDYVKRGWTQEPFAFVKNNAGTYGLAVVKVEKGQDVLDWSYKARKKMKAAKGGRDVEEVIIQEGIPSVVEQDGVVAEPVIYMIGSELAGGFLRTHGEKSSTESLNSPGAIYKKLCVSDLELRPEGCPKENVYGWTSKLGALAITMEAKDMGIQIP
jgi:glutamate--cysteine ligase